jgi:hypothetical protein
MEPLFIDRAFVDFMENNLKNNPGTTELRVNVHDKERKKVLALSGIGSGINLNDELIDYLNEHGEIGVSVVS